MTVNREVNREKMRELDGHWQEVVRLAGKYGFISFCFSGTAILMTHAEQLKAAKDEEEYIRRQKVTFGIDMEAE